ncbi:DUF308 domain-containing protein [Pseudonocardia sp. ICBG601]|uniref:DUF308 domain-containing protein n=1 Tax=Pseudonocardia sp. ICBG601 TaxID=2846759 RepID=UPI001CF66D19|nr:DUF308 domain-containing protein [Pseudonocardia sp. ICBG601]
MALLAVVVATGMLVAPQVTVVVGAVIGVLAAVWGAFGAWGGVELRAHRRRFLWPLHRALAGVLDPPTTHPQTWLHIPPGFSRAPGLTMRIDLPATFTGLESVKDHVREVVVAKLGLAPETVFSFHLAGDKPYVTFVEPVRPPAKVGYDDLLPLLATSAETAPIVGLAADRVPVPVDLENDSPHVLISCGSGGGKSVLVRTITAQGLAKGGYGVICDVKRISHMWARNLRNCEYHRTAESIHERLLSLRAEVDRRNALVERYADIDGNTDHIDVGPRIWVAIEEMNATIGRLSKYWRSIKEKGEPNTSPAVEALLDILFMGRQIKVHVVTVAQLATARTVGGPEARENFGTRCLARYSVNAWRMLCPEVWPMPKKSRRMGRWQIVTGGAATETQVVFLTPRQARELAQMGIPQDLKTSVDESAADSPGWLSQVSQVSQDRTDQGNQPGTVPGCQPGTATPPSPVSPRNDGCDDEEYVQRVQLVGLRQAVDDDLVEGMSLNSLRKESRRDEHFPVPRGRHGQMNLYPADELGRWARNRRTVKERNGAGGCPADGATPSVGDWEE